MTRVYFISALLGLIALTSRAPCADSGDRTYVPSPDDDIEMLGALVTRRVPSLQSDLLAAEVARADARQARLYGNPAVDVTWGTIPIGPTNPSGLDAPLANVPNYSVGASYTFLLGKRTPRKERADALLEGANHAVAASARAQALSLARVLGRLAVTRLRVDGLHGLADQQRSIIALTRLRLDQGFGTPLDVDRLEIELSRIEQQLLSAQGDERAGLAACSSYVGIRCTAVATEADARHYVVAWAKRAKASADRVAERSDVRALDAYRRAAVAEAELARAQAIPDPTVRLGYTHDRFVISGNQANSLSLSLTIPVPIFDRGQAQVQAADARRARYDRLRDMTMRTGLARIEALRELLKLMEQRQDAVAKVLPRAKAVVDDLQRVATGRLLPLTDVIQARRTLDELLIQEADSYNDMFQVAVDLLAETGPRAASPTSDTRAKGE